MITLIKSKSKLKFILHSAVLNLFTNAWIRVLYRTFHTSPLSDIVFIIIIQRSKSSYSIFYCRPVISYRNNKTIFYSVLQMPKYVDVLILLYIFKICIHIFV